MLYHSTLSLRKIFIKLCVYCGEGHVRLSMPTFYVCNTFTPIMGFLPGLSLFPFILFGLSCWWIIRDIYKWYSIIITSKLIIYLYLLVFYEMCTQWSPWIWSLTLFKSQENPSRYMVEMGNINSVSICKLLSSFLFC